MKKYLETQKVFNSTLRFLALLSKGKVTQVLIPFFTSVLAKLNLFLNNPKPAKNGEELGETWKSVMPSDGQHNFKIQSTDAKTAFVEIHLHCPLRGTGKVQTCYEFMNYDRQLMKKVGGQLVVLESQSSSSKPYCKLAIRKAGASIDDLTPAHLKN